MFMKAIRVQWYKPFTLQLVISLLYLSITSYQFVKSDPPNPIGIGLLQWLLIIVHVLCVTIYYFIKRGTHIDKQATRQIFLMNILGIIIPNGVCLLFSGPIWHWLWSLR
jgi:hypothetical protein